MAPHSRNNTLSLYRMVRSSEQGGGVVTCQAPKACLPALQPQGEPAYAVPANAVLLGATGSRRFLAATGSKGTERSESSRLSQAPEPVAGSLDTTGQLGHSAQRTLQKRARRKSLGEAVARRLLLNVPDSPLRFGYRRTLECASTLWQTGDKVVAKYCRARWCPVCSAIRTAKWTVAYAPELATWTDSHFVTLSRPNVKAANLNGELRSLGVAFVLLAKNVRRTDGIAFRAVRKLEVTYNRDSNTYHPHLHLLVDSKAAGEAMIRRWLAMNPTAKPEAQDCRPADSPMEVLKYCTKLLVKGLDGKQTMPPAHALDTIFKALKGLRTVQPMGFKVPALAVVADDEALELDASTPAPTFSPEPVEWVPWLYDWVDKATGEVVADYSPSLSWAEVLARISRSPD